MQLIQPDSFSILGAASHLNALDYSIIGAYMAVLLGIGMYLKKRAAASLEDYYLGGRKLPWYLLGLSSTAAMLDMTGTMVVVSFLFMLGPRGLFVEFRGGACLILIPMMLWIGKWHRRSGVMTGAEWMIYRFGSGVWGNFARLSCVVAAVVGAVGSLAYAFKGGGLFLSMFLPFSPLVCAVIMIVVTAIYTLESGFYGVVFTDLFQSICILAGVVFIVIMAVAKVAGCEDMGALAAQVTGNADWLSSVPQWQTTMPKGYENYSFLTAIALFYLVKSFIQGMGVGTDPKYFGAKSDRDCGKLTFFSGWTMMTRWPLMLGFTVLGLFLVKDLFPNQDVLAQASAIIKANADQAGVPVSMANWHELTTDIMNHPEQYSAIVPQLQQLLGGEWDTKLNLLSYNGTVDPEQILPAVILFNVPPGLRGLMLTALLAAAMSTINSFVNTTAGYLTRDLYQGYMRKTATNKELIYASYVFSALLVVGGLAMMYFSKNINDIWGWLTVGLIGGLTVPTILRCYWWRFNGGGFAIGTIVGLLASVGLRMWQMSHPEVDMPEWWQYIYLLGSGLVGSVVGTYVTKPTDRAVLEKFYKDTRPFGLWKPLEKVLSPEMLHATKREHFYDILSIPFGLGWIITLFLLPMQLMIKQWEAAAYTSSIFVVSLIGLYFFWYTKLPPDPASVPTAKPESQEAV